MARDSFILYTEQKEIFENLSNEQAGKLIKGIFEYIETEKEPNLDGLLKIAFIPIRQNLDRNNDKWEDIKQKRSEAGKKSAEIKKQQKVTNLTNVDFVKNKTTNSTVNVNDNVNVNVNVNDNVVVEEVKEENDSCVDGFQKVIDFYNSNIGLITPYCLEILQDYAKEMDIDVVIYAMQKAVEANKRTTQYIKAILNNWDKKGIRTLIDAQEENRVYHKQVVPKEETEEEKNARRAKELEEAMNNDKW